jgi:branched-chain amino acid transport system permease protein
MGAFFQQVVNGCLVGFNYAMVAIGLTMIYGVLRILHIAHAVIYTVGAYIGLLIFTYTGSFILAIVGAMIGCGIVGIAINRFIYMPVLKLPREVVMIASIGLLVAITDLVRLIFGPSEQAFAVKLPFGGQFLGVRFGGPDTLILICFCVAMLILWYVMKHTRAGFAIRAIAQNQEAAELMGVNRQRNIQVVFFIGSALAGLAGVLVGVVYNSIFPTMGDVYAYKALAIIVIGGFGSVVGSILGGLFLGLSETLVTTYTNIPLGREGIAMLFLIILLLIRPGGLMGRKE